MSRYLKQYEKEHMKMAMLKQEEMFKQQVQELHRLYQVQRQLMTGTENTMPSARCKPEDERHTQENEVGSSRSWNAYSEQRKAPVVLEESELELTLALGGFGTAGNKAPKKEMSSSVSSRTSISSSSTESGSPDCRVLPLHPVKASPNVGQHMEQESSKHPPWLHQCLNLAR